MVLAKVRNAKVSAGQPVKNVRLSYKELERTAKEERQKHKQERKKRKQAEIQYKEHISTCVSNTAAIPDTPRTTSAASDTPLISTAVLRYSNSMDDELVTGPFTRPCTATPVCCTAHKNLEDASMTPVSLSHQNSMHSPRPASANLCLTRSRDFALLNDCSDDMDTVDNTSEAGPFTSNTEMELAMYRTQLDEVSTLLGVSSSLDHVIHTLQEMVTSRDSLEKDLHAMTVQYVDTCNYLETLSNERDTYTQRLLVEQEETEMEMVHGLLLEQKCESYRAAGLDQARKISAFAQMGMSRRNGL